MNNKDILDEVWGIPEKVKGNCYVFGLAPKIGRGGYWKNRMYKARPGDKCEEHRNKSFDFNKCEDIIKRVLCDNPKYVKRVHDLSMCFKPTAKDTHLMCAVLSPGPSQDFHFLRRMKYKDVMKYWDKLKLKMPVTCIADLLNNEPEWVWIHQRGWSSGGPIIHDAKGKVIRDPFKANFNYGRLNYSTRCGIFEVKTRMATVTNEFDF